MGSRSHDATNDSDDAIGVIENVVVAESDDGGAELLEVLGAPRVLLGDVTLIVNVAVDLDDEAKGQAAEIAYEWSDRMLSAEPYAELVLPQMTPERVFSRHRPTP